MDSEMRQDRVAATATNAQKNNQFKDGERFVSKIFIISVGQSGEDYAVHESVLRQSPVFAAMCHGHFKEAHERRILLPADDPKDLAAIVEYLYVGDFKTVGNPNAGPSRQDCAFELASLYVTAEKYRLDAMKKLVVEKLRSCTDPSAPAEWLAVGDLIYSATPSTDDVYPTYLQSLLIDLMYPRGGVQDPGTIDLVDQWVEKGGRLAVDINRACNAYWVKKIERRAAAFKRIRESREKECSDHRRRHPRCRSCFGDPFEMSSYQHFEMTGDRIADMSD
ncbi:MAG: hypothetical protein LQ338_007953 [Usnochroma carphineum]|nr:MAG: hypothetical protein LQ338_007953 [Usnochroma carphineum]